MKTLLHICCAQCAVYPQQALRNAGHEVQGFFYNPNIHPYQEYQRRLDSVKMLPEKIGLKLLLDDSYDLEAFLRLVVFREDVRCRHCYFMRLEKTAQFAKRGKFDAFTTTLLVSPHQKHEVIRETGESLAEAYGLMFHYEDFRPGWPEGRALAKEYGFYRQQYCGCVYSEKDRYLPSPGKDSPRAEKTAAAK